jgi:hypothetical protein
VYQDQKVHLFRPSLSFLAEAQPRLENRRGQKLATSRTQAAHRSNLFCIYLFENEINLLTAIFFIVFLSACQQNEKFTI